MTCNLPPRVARYRGMSLLELSVILATLLMLIAMLIVGTRAWRRGSDRAGCVLTLRAMQMATRSYQNMYNYNPGGRPYAEHGTQDIAEHLYVKGYIEEKLYGQTLGTRHCSGGGSYARPLPDVFPQEGHLYMTCSLSEEQSHSPAAHENW